jgi:uncharacterized protein (TIGR02145 family)
MRTHKITFLSLAVMASVTLLVAQAPWSKGTEHVQYKQNTQNSEKVTDIDGNEYTTIKIGQQTWMVENLKTTRFRNGNPIETTDPFNKRIVEEMDPVYQWAYMGKEENVDIYGRLYTWYAATDPREIAPDGWRVPTEQDFINLALYLIENGAIYSYDKTNFGTTANNTLAKALSSTTGWFPSSVDGSPGSSPELNNASGFTAVPGGRRINDGVMVYGPGATNNNLASFWASTEVSGTHGRARWYFANGATFSTRSAGENKQYGKSIRLIKDEQLSVNTPLTENADLKLFPTQVQSEMSIRFTATSAETVKFEVIALNGSVVLQDSYLPVMGVNLHTMDVNQLEKGVYFLRISNNKLAETAKFVKF